MPKALILLFTLLSYSTFSSAQTYYISDNLFTYIHSGPSDKYRIVGSVNAGEHIKVLQHNAETGYTQIIDAKGRKGWLVSKYVSANQSLKERLPLLEEKVKQLNLQLNHAQQKANEDQSSLKQNLVSRSQQIQLLENNNIKLNKELQKVQAINRKLSATLDTQKTDILMRWFTYGGMVAGIGLILGLLLPHLIPSRRRKDRWM